MGKYVDRQFTKGGCTEGQQAQGRTRNATGHQAMEMTTPERAPPLPVGTARDGLTHQGSARMRNSQPHKLWWGWSTARHFGKLVGRFLQS